MILQPARKRRPSEDDSFTGIRVGVLLLAALVLFGALVFRLWYLQILSGDEFTESATVNRVRTVMVEAPRGVIYDRDGNALVENRAGLSIGFLTMDMYDPEEEAFQFQAEISKLATLLEMSTSDLLVAYKKAARDPYVTYMVKEDVPEETVVAYLKEHSLEFPGVQVEKTFLRQYPEKALAAHLLGYVNEIGAQDIGGEEFPGLTAGAHVGKDGVERTYDSYLRGTDGWKRVEVDAAGRPIEFIENVAAIAGNNLILTIDSDLQKAAEDAIAEGIQRAHQDDFTNAAGGAVVALDPRNGEVLAMASYPDYDPSVWVGGIEQAAYDELRAEEANKPLFNRALNGLYPAGSTFKPFVAAVAMNAGVVTPDELIYCDGSFERAGQKWKDWTLDGHGNVNLVQAIMESCDVFFYNMGSRLYDLSGAVFQQGIRQFGFGAESTGVDLPGETRNSRVPDKTWKREYYKDSEASDAQIWKPGDEINLAIGQGDLLVTPLQLAVATAAIANGGTRWVPHLGLQITDASGRVIWQYEPESASVGITTDKQGNDILSIVRKGMRLVTSDAWGGTAYAAFWGFPVAVGGKTGTAQKPGQDDYALFMGYAPANADADGNVEPEIVVVAIVEEGGHGSSVAAPVVRRVMEAYFGYEPGGSIQVPFSE
ncbi:MAG: penicillin-binding protein 2 [Thermoleophilia bacterium]|nr:penicillin-binding protein 2 [Thermoleophilia bacterium]